MSFYDRIRSIQRKNNSLLCIGLDPDLDKLPKHLLSHAAPVVRFCEEVVEATGDLACAYKLNLAFFEHLGEKYWRSVRRVLACIPRDIMTIGDAKRGDIGNTSVMYARTLFKEFRFTAATVNAYMGEDSVRPFMENPERGVFILALTSNPGAKDFQYLRTRRRPLFEQVVVKAKKWNDKKNIGFVVGATRPAQLKRVRQLAPDMPLLIPGVGLQGGDVKSTVRFGCDGNGEMSLVNASRSIIYASCGKDFAEAARTAAENLRNELNRHRGEYFP